MNKERIISDLDQLHKSDNLIQELVSMCGAESFRPHLEHLKGILKDDIRKIESSLDGIVVIAGTNGKGECAHALKDLLEWQGSRVAMWTSPHVLLLSERFYFSCGSPDITSIAKLVKDYSHIQKTESLSFYEFLFFLFVKYLVNSLESCDYLVLEVGLGGRFDAVNIFNNPLCAITSISRDHTAILGNDLKTIMGEKYGITRRGGVLYSNIEQDFLSLELKNWTMRDEIRLIEPKIQGDYSRKNRGLAIKLFNHFYPQVKVSEDFSWNVSKGRTERVTINDRTFIFIGAHNLDGHRKMLDSLYQSKQRVEAEFILAFSTGREGDIDDILALYKRYPCIVKGLRLSSFNSPRAVERDILEQSAARHNIGVLTQWNELLDDQYIGKEIFVTGSYFFIGEFQRFIHTFFHS